MQKLENERIILLLKKNLAARLPAIALIVGSCAAAYVKAFRSDGILAGFAPITDIRQYNLFYALEWSLLGAALVTGILWLLALSGRMVFLTNVRIVVTRTKTKYEDVFPTGSCLKAEKRFPGKLILTFPSRQIVLKNFSRRDDFIGELQQLKSFSPVTRSTSGSPDPATEGEKLTSGTSVTQARENPSEMLDSLIGLTPVKTEIVRLRNYSAIVKLRRDQGLPVSGLTLHSVFLGNPGTGKTTVARIMASILKENGILESGHVVETDRSGLVGEYVGQTAVKTNRVIDKALNVVLFIDEAYMLSEGGGNDYGQEAIATLLKRMEDDRERLVVILAGYGRNMENFLDSNPGLRSRFSRKISFPDYSPAELVEIFHHFCKKNGYFVAPEGEKKLLEVMNRKTISLDVRSGNARFARNLFEICIQNQATRLSQGLNNTVDDLKTILSCDLPD